MLSIIEVIGRVCEIALSRRQADDAIVWDNWRVIHGATGVPFDVERLAQRTTIVGDYKLGRYLDPAPAQGGLKRRLDD